MSKSPASGAIRAHRRRQAGAVALEYILITALVAIALIAVFRMWGKVTAAAVADTAVDTGGALVKEP